MTRRGKRSRRETQLQRLLDARGIPPSLLQAKLRTRMGDYAPDEQLVRRWRFGRAEPRRKNMVRLLWAVRQAANDASIRIEDIFDFDPDNSANWED